jgi:thioredoxin 1
MSHNTFEVTSANFQTQVLDAELPVLVDFGADWCPPCKMIAPVVDDMAAKYAGKLRVGTLDVDANPDVMERYGVMGLPTLILFQGGSPVKRIVGYTPGHKLEAQIVPHLPIEQA